MKTTRSFETLYSRIEFDTKHVFSMALAVLLLVNWYPNVGLAYFAGNGSFQNPYQLSTVDDLLELSMNPKDNHKHFVLVADIDADGYLFQQAVIGATDDSELDDEGFFGTINGNGHVIRNLTIQGNNNVGLFGVVKPDAQIRGIGVVDANVVAIGECTGILVGYNEGLISNCYATGMVRGETSVGGLVGRHNGEMSDCYVTAQIAGTHLIGGLAGESWGAVTTNCYSASLFNLEGTSEQEYVYGLLCPVLGLNSFWDAQLNELSGITFWPALNGLSTEQMMDANTFLDAGWDFLGEATNGHQETWTMPTNGGYPVLSLFQGIAVPWPCDNGTIVGACTLSNDPNEVLWDSQSVFLPEWESRTVSDIVRNPAPNPLLENNLERTIAISGNLSVLDANNLLGISTEHSTLCQALDQTGTPIEINNTPALFEPRRGWSMLPSIPRSFSIELLLNPNQPMPTALTQVDFFVHALYARSVKVIDIPFEASNDWIEIVPDLSVRIDRIEYKDDHYYYHVTRKHFGNQLATGILTQDYLVSDFTLLDHVDIICNMDFVDQQGNVVTFNDFICESTARSRGDAFILTGGFLTWTNNVEFVRFTVALEPYQMIVPLTLTDIPILSE